MPHPMAYYAYSEFHVVLMLPYAIDTLKGLPLPKCTHNYNFVLGCWKKQRGCMGNDFYLCFVISAETVLDTSIL